MSRVGKNPIPVPAGVEVTLLDRHVAVSGPNGRLEHDLPGEITVRKENSTLLVERPDDERHNRALHGLTRSLVANMVTGVTTGYQKDLEIVGVGYRATAKGAGQIELALGFSHPVVVNAPEGITFEVPVPTRITVRGRTSRGSARWRPTSARSESRSPIRAKESATRAKSSSARQGRQPSSHVDKQDSRAS